MEIGDRRRSPNSLRRTSETPVSISVPWLDERLRAPGDGWEDRLRKVSTTIFSVFYMFTLIISLILSAYLDLYKAPGYTFITIAMCFTVGSMIMLVRTRDVRWALLFGHVIATMLCVMYPLLVPFTTGVGIVDEAGEPKLFNYFVLPLAPPLVAFTLRSHRWIVVYTGLSAVISFTMCMANPRGDDVRGVPEFITGTVLIQLIIAYICASFQAVADNLHDDHVMAQGRVKDAEREAQAERQANQAKTRFVSVMSHEIRNPLQVILLQLELLGTTSLTHRQQGYLAGSMRASNLLLAIVNDILDVSKIEAGAVVLESVELSLRATVEEIVRAHMPQASRKGIQLIVNVDPTLNTSIRGDPTRLRQVVENLVNNAVKFTEAGDVEVTVAKGRAVGAGVHQWRVAVRDTGIGVADECKHKLFQTFSQVDDTTTRVYGGTGLGLFICRGLAELMGGSVSVESTLGVGSTFALTFRAASASTDDRQPLHCIPVPPRTSVVVYASNESVVEVLRQNLAALLEGPAIEMLCTRQAAFAEQHVRECTAARSGVPVLVLAEYRDCPMTLLSTLNAARSSGTISIMVTDDPTEVEADGWDYCVTQPISLQQLRAALCRALDCGDAAARTQGVPAVDHPGTGAPVVLVVDDVDGWRVPVQEMIEDMGYRTLSAANGKEAVASVRRHYDELGLVLMDCEVASRDGYSATEAIRHFEGERGIPADEQLVVCAMAANAQHGQVRGCIEHGMTTYLSKPVNRSDLQSVLKQYARLRKLPASTQKAKARSKKRRNKGTRET